MMIFVVLALFIIFGFFVYTARKQILHWKKKKSVVFENETLIVTDMEPLARFFDYILTLNYKDSRIRFDGMLILKQDAEIEVLRDYLYGKMLELAKKKTILISMEFELVLEHYRKIIESEKEHRNL